MIKYTLLLLLIISSIFLQTTSAICITRTWTVHITNNLPDNSPPLTVHCRSKDDDLGVKTIPVLADYNFSFCINPISTQYSCDFQWNGKAVALEIYKPPFRGTCSGPVCSYTVITDGLYYTNSYPPPPGTLKKVVSW
ncbi:hypothetical protein ACS0TY_009353 [Phlomoides rotata]